MEFSKTYSREHLQALYRKSCLETIKQQVETMSNVVLQTAVQGQKTSHMFVITKNTRPVCIGYYIPTPDDLVDGLKQMFPDCDVTLKDEWIDVRPGVREQRTGIVVDWS